MQSKIRAKGDGSWGTKTVNGKEYIRLSKVVGLRYRKRVDVYAATEKECLKKMREKERAYIEQESISESALSPTENKVRLEDAMWDWMITYKLPSMKPRSFQRLVGTYNAHIRNTSLGKSEIRNIQSKHIQKRINQVYIEKSYSTTKKVYDLLNMFFEHYFSKYPTSSPMVGVIKPKRKQEITLDEEGSAEACEMVVLSDEEIDNLLEELHREQSSMCYFLEFLLWSFVRVGEAKALQAKDIDLEESTVKIYKSYSRTRKSESYDKEGKKKGEYEWKLVTPKTKQGIRILNLCPDAVEALNNHYRMLKTRRKAVLGGKSDISHEVFIFNTMNGNPYPDQDLNDLLRGVLERAGIKKKITIHGLRHTGISYFLRHGADIKTISIMAGHADVSVTMKIYYNIVKDQLNGYYDAEYWEFDK